MTRRDLVLAALASAKGAGHSPIQVQKILFLIDRNLSPKITGAPRFSFRPYNYGPFDQSVYAELDQLELEGLLQRTPNQTWNDYQLTPEGQAAGQAALASLDETARNYLQLVSDFVRALSFTQLVSAIYKAYPEMAVNSVFHG